MDIVASFNTLLDRYLGDFLDHFKQQMAISVPADARDQLAQAIAHSIYNPGKRIRPLICLTLDYALTQHTAVAAIIGTAIECIHCYSLIHDDLPDMDNDTLRRGQPTCHVVYGNDMAILAGDTLNTFAFEYLARDLPSVVSAETSLYVIRHLANACGIHGMAGGQAMDLRNHGRMDAQTLATIHALKTGRLLRACFELVAYCQTQDPAIRQQLTTIGTQFGLLFQIVDDIIDATSTTEALGKSAGKDVAQNKLTYVTLLGCDAARALAHDNYTTLIALIDALPFNTSELHTIVTYIYSRSQ